MYFFYLKKKSIYIKTAKQNYAILSKFNKLEENFLSKSNFFNQFKEKLINIKSKRQNHAIF